MLNEGLATMATGMGTVFSFLVILWIAVSLMGKIVGYLNKIFPEQIVSLEKPSKTKSVSDDEAIAVALAVIKARG